MDYIIRRLEQLSIKNGIISEEDLPWFRYGLEKRIVTLFVGIPFFFVACRLAGVAFSICFFLSYALLRRKTNGYHSDTIIGCLVASLTVEVVFILCYSMVLNTVWMIISNIVSFIVIALLAPYNDAKLHLTEQEQLACKHYSRAVMLFLAIIAIILNAVGWTDASYGITVGAGMASFLLCLAYLKRRIVV